MTKIEQLQEVIYLLAKTQLDSCPRWVEGIGDCKLDKCEFCRVQKCIDYFESELAALKSQEQKPKGEVKESRSTLLTDDEINDWLKFEHIPMGLTFKEGKIEGAKWARDKMKQEIKLLNEIINNQHKLMINAEKRGYDKARGEVKLLFQSDD